MKTRTRLLRSVILLSALFSLPFCSQGAALVSTNVVAGGGHWNNNIWKTNLTDTVFVGTPVAGNTYTLLANTFALSNNAANARLRNPVVVGGPAPVFGGDSLTLSANTEIRFKTNASLVPFTCIFPGVGGNPGLILNGGALNAGDDATFVLSGRVSVASASLITPSDGPLGNFRTARGIRIGAILEGTGPLIVVNAATNIPSLEISSSNNTFSGDLIVKSGFLRGTSPGSLGSGNITLNPTYVLPSTLYAAGTPLSNGPVRFEVNYDMITTGALTMTNNSLMFLHQNIRVGSLRINGTNLAQATYPYATLTNMFPTYFSPGGSGSIAVGPPPPVISLVAPLDGSTFYPAGNGLSFNVNSTTPMFTNTITLLLNGVNVSSGMAITGTDLNAAVSYAGLLPNTVYTATIIASNASAAATTSFVFDTLAAGANVFLEAEDYDFGDGDCSLATEPIDGGAGGFYLNNPAPGAYSNFIATFEVDYHDTALIRSSPVTNAYRQCDYVGTRLSTDVIHPPFVVDGFPDFDVWQMQAGEWLNYTRDYPAGNYLVYLRSVSTANNTFQLEKVISGVGTTTQTTSLLGMFNVPNTAGAYRYRPLTDALGNNAVVHLTGAATTLRVTALNANNNVQINSLVLIPVAGTVPPFLASASPASGNTNVLPDAVVTAVIAAGDTMATPGSVLVRFNGSYVTASASIGTVGDTVTISYDPPGFLATNTAYTVSLEYQDNAPSPVSYTNTWSFTTVPALPVLPLDFATAAGSGTDAGFNIKIRKGPNTSTTAAFPSSLLRTEQHLADQIINPATGQPWINDASPGTATVSVINFEQSGGLVVGAGNFTSANGFADAAFPLIPVGDPRWTNDPNFISLEATFYLELPVGVHRIGVRSDDGFRLTAGPVFNNTNLVLMQFDAGRGDSPSEVDVQVGTAGVYAFRLTYFEGTGGASLELYTVNRSTGVRTLVNSGGPGAIPAFRSRTQEPAGAPPLIVNISPANNTFFSGATTLSFEALTSSGNTIEAGGIQLSLNGSNVTSSLVVGGTSTARTAAFNGLQPNQAYRATISVTDLAGHSSTQSVGFDTFDFSQVVTVEAENYNYAQTACPVAATFGGLSDPLAPVDGYFGYASLSGVDYFDTGTSISESVYRPCDFMSTQVSPDALRPAYAGTNDFQLWRLKANEWANYTLWFDATPVTYMAYARVSSSAARQLTLSRVIGESDRTGQTADLIGTFRIPNTGGSASFQYVLLTDALGNPATMSLASVSENPTLRLTSVDANNDVQVNFFVLVPVGGGSPPAIVAATPAPGSLKVQPGVPINISVANSTTALNTNTVALSVNGVDVTSSSIITGDAYLTTISYTPPTLWPLGSVQTVRLLFNDDGAPVTTVSNQWAFTVASGFVGVPLRVNFSQPGGTTYPGYLQDTGSVFSAKPSGYSYGWNRDIAVDGRTRGSANSPDARYDTLLHMRLVPSNATWEVALPNETYIVRTVGGDPTAVDSVLQFLYESSVSTPTYVPVSGAWWADFTNEVTVADGRLTIDIGPSAANDKICFVEIIPPVLAVAPTVSRTPTNVTINAGESATFSVTVRGTETLYYQWLHGGSPIPGANGSTYLVSNAGYTDIGSYSVLVTNNAGSVTSAAATLTVNGANPPIVRMNIVQQGTNVFITWTNTPAGFVLKESTNLVPPITWSTNTNAVINANGNFGVTVPAGTGNKYFRLEL